MTTALPEISEAEATGETAEIYEDIRRCLQVNNVNLIYRYFATIDKALPWVWTILRSSFENGRLEECAQNKLSMFCNNFQGTPELSTTTLTLQEREKISRILDFYLKANPMNLVALLIIRNAVIEQGYSPNGSQIHLLPIAKIQEAACSRQFDSTTQELMFYVSQGVTNIRPTLLRQIAAWPHYVESIAEFIKVASCDIQFEQQTKSIYERALNEARNFHHVETLQNINAKAITEIGEFSHYFPVILIRMTLIAEKLRSKL